MHFKNQIFKAIHQHLPLQLDQAAFERIGQIIFTLLAAGSVKSADRDTVLSARAVLEKEGYQVKLDMPQNNGEYVMWLPLPVTTPFSVEQYITNHTTPPRIERPWMERMVFVFGSNLLGIHGAGAALTAACYWGAVRGTGKGFMGFTNDVLEAACYAIPTKEKPDGPTLDLDYIKHEVDKLSVLVHNDSNKPAGQRKQWMVTAVGCGLAGLKPEQVAPLFIDFVRFPNVCLPKEFWDVLRPMLVVHSIRHFNDGRP